LPADACNAGFPNAMTRLSTSRSTLLLATALVLGLMGLALAGGGAWLAALGGSWFYLGAGIALLLCALLLARASRLAWWVQALLLLTTTAWSLWEVGLDWWAIAIRCDVPFLIGLFLLLPAYAHRLQARDARGDLHSAARWPAGRTVLALSLLLFAGVAVASWFVDPHRKAGTLVSVPLAAQTAGAASGPASAPEVPAGEWHAYGRTGHGQRFSPLTQITPDNVDELQVAWEFRTGDMRGRAGDPEETTFEVTPLKIGDRLFLCTPHQQVIALDATSGQQVWRYDPRVRSGLALQHLTCRGLGYHPGAGGAAGPATNAASAPVASASASAPAASAPAATAPQLPVAAADGPAVDRCDARLFMPTADGRLIALDPSTGAVCRDFGRGTGQINLWRGMPNVRLGGYYATSPPVVTQRLVIVGGTVLDNVSTTEPSGVIRAFDVETGELVWNFDPGRPEQTEPLPAGQTYVQSTPNSWSISAVDEALGMVYVPMGNQPPDQWGANRSPEVERYASSILALDLATGRERWVFQTVHHDLWDYDVPAQPSLLDLSVSGARVPALVQPTKQGEIFVLDRRSGRPLLPVNERPVPQGAEAGDHTAPTQPVSALSFSPPQLTGASMWGASWFDQMGCRIALKRLRYEGRYTPPSKQGTLVYPGNFGVFNWGSIAVDPERQVAFVTPTYLAFLSTLVPRPDNTSLVVQGEERPHDSLPALNENFGAPYAVKLSAFTSPLGLPCQQPPWGHVAGVDLTTGQVAYMHRNGTVRDLAPVPLPLRMGVPNLGGPIVTAGGVAFLSGTLDYYVRGYELATGRELWKARLPAGGQATPMTYQGRDGRQYLLVVAGGHGSLGTKAGDHVIAYALPPS
jgi:quinoprotein glucose dehydrogenase